MKPLAPELQLIMQMLQDYSFTPTSDLAAKLNWRILFKLSVRHRITHQVNAYIKQLADKTLIPRYADLTKFCQKDQLQLLLIAGETVRLAQEFNRDNFDYAVVKGVVLNVHIYHQLDNRSCRDIDVWVDIKHFKRATDALYRLDYVKQLPVYELNGFKGRYYLTHRHDIAFYNSKRQVLVELHFRLDYFGINYFSMTPTILQPITILNTPVYSLDDNYNLLYLMLHAAIHAYSRLRWLNDIAVYLKSGKCTLSHVLELAREINATHFVLLSLVLVRDNLAVDDRQLNLLIQESDGFLLKRANHLAKLCKEFIQADYELIDGVGSSVKMFVKYRWYLFLLAAKGQKINAIIGDLFKIDYLFPYITLPRGMSFLYYVLYPLWAVKYLIRGIFMRKSRKKGSI